MIRETSFAGLEALELSDGSIRMLVVSSVGPRIAHFALIDRDNLLAWDDDGVHRRKDWRLYGGHRLWLTRPGADEGEETYAPDNARCTVRELPGGVAVTAPPDPAQLQRTIEVHADGPHWRIRHRVRNVGDMLWSGGAWALTCTRPLPETVYRVPLDRGPAGWDVVTLILPRRWGGGHTSALVDPQIELTEEALLARSLGTEAKRMISAPRGTIEMHDPARGLFSKTATFDRHASYPLGTNLAIYLAPRSFMVEMETMGPLVTLVPDEELVHDEVWTIAAT